MPSKMPTFTGLVVTFSISQSVEESLTPENLTEIESLIADMLGSENSHIHEVYISSGEIEIINEDSELSDEEVSYLEYMIH